jgi:AcrR family transcriptional regulator
MSVTIENTKKAKSYHKILKHGRVLFWKYGIKKVNVEDICRAAGISKMTFYRNFDNKIHVAKLLLEMETARSVDEYRDIMESDDTFPTKVSRIVRMKIERSKDVSREIVSDIYNHEFPELENLLNDVRSQFQTDLKNDFTKAQKKGEIRPKLKIDFLLKYLYHLQNMMADREMLDSFDSMADLAGQMTEIFFFGIVPHETQS